MALVGFRAPALPVPPREYSPQQQSELVRTLRLYFNLIDFTDPAAGRVLHSRFIYWRFF
jgi:hypothetical protein